MTARIRDALTNSECLLDAATKVHESMFKRIPKHQYDATIKLLVEEHISDSYSNQLSQNLVELVLLKLICGICETDPDFSLRLTLKAIGKAIFNGSKNERITSIRLLCNISKAKLDLLTDFPFSSLEACLKSPDPISIELCVRLLEKPEDQLKQRMVLDLMDGLLVYVSRSTQADLLERVLKLVPPSNLLTESLFNQFITLESSYETRVCVYEYVLAQSDDDHDISFAQIEMILFFGLQDDIGHGSEWVVKLLNKSMIQVDSAMKFLDQLDLGNRFTRETLEQCIRRCLKCLPTQELIQFLKQIRSYVSCQGLFVMVIGLDVLNASDLHLNELFNDRWFDNLLGLIDIPCIMDEMVKDRRDLFIEQMFRIAKHVLRFESDHANQQKIIMSVANAFSHNFYVNYDHAEAAYSVISCDSNIVNDFMQSIIQSLQTQQPNEKQLAMICVCVANKDWSFGIEPITRSICTSMTRETNLVRLAIALFSICELNGQKLPKIKGIYENALSHFDVNVRLSGFESYCCSLMRLYATKTLDEEESRRLILHIGKLHLNYGLNHHTKTLGRSLMNLMKCGIMFTGETIALVLLMFTLSMNEPCEFGFNYEAKTFLQSLTSVATKRNVIRAILDSLVVFIERDLGLLVCSDFGETGFPLCVKMWKCLIEDLKTDEDTKEFSNQCGQLVIRVLDACSKRRISEPQLLIVLNIIPWILEGAMKSMTALVKEQIIYEFGKLGSFTKDRSLLKQIVKLTNSVNKITEEQLCRPEENLLPKNFYIDQSNITVNSSSVSICIQDTETSQDGTDYDMINDHDLIFPMEENVDPLTKQFSKSKYSISAISNSVKSLNLLDEISE